MEEERGLLGEDMLRLGLNNLDGDIDFDMICKSFIRNFDLYDEILV